MKNRIDMVALVAYHHIELGAIGETNHQYDTIKDVYCSRWIRNVKGGYKLSKEWDEKSTTVLGTIFKQLICHRNILILCPCLELLLACSRFQYWIKEFDLQFGKLRPKPRLHSQAEFEDYTSQFFVKNGSSILMGLVNDKINARVWLSDLRNYGFNQYDEGVILPEGITREVIMHAYKNLDYDYLGSVSRKINAEFIEKLLSVTKEEGLPSITFSIGGLARGIFDAKSSKNSLEETSDEGTANAERLCYLGARMQSFGSGKYNGKVYHLDISSHYPFQCLSRELPTSLKETIINPKIDELCQNSSGLLHFAKVFIETDEPLYPIKRKGGILYPVGKFWAWLCCAELQEAFDRGHIKKCSFLAKYNKGRPLKRLMEHLLSMRFRHEKANDKIKAMIYKYLANSIIGKISQIGKAFVRDYDTIPDFAYGFFHKHNPVSGETEEYRVIDWVVEKVVNGIEVRGTYPSISAAINSYARWQVTKLMEIAGKDNVLLVCSDTLTVTEKGRENLLPFISEGEKEPGKLYLAGESDYCTIITSSIYESNSRKKVSGQHSGNQPTPQDFMLAISESGSEPSTEADDFVAVMRKTYIHTWDKEFRDFAEKPWAFHHQQEVLEESPDSVLFPNGQEIRRTYLAQSL